MQISLLSTTVRSKLWLLSINFVSRISVPVRHWLHSAIFGRVEPLARIKISSASKMGGRSSEGQGKLISIIGDFTLIFVLPTCSVTFNRSTLTLSVFFYIYEVLQKSSQNSSAIGLPLTKISICLHPLWSSPLWHWYNDSSRMSTIGSTFGIHFMSGSSSRSALRSGSL